MPNRRSWATTCSHSIGKCVSRSRIGRCCVSSFDDGGCSDVGAVTPALVRSLLQPCDDLKRHGHEEGAPEKVAECGDAQACEEIMTAKTPADPAVRCGGMERRE